MEPWPARGRRGEHPPGPQRRHVRHRAKTGQFLWATPFPYDAPNFLISNIDGKTGKTTINWDLVFKDKSEKNHTICFYNARSYWPTAYSPKTNSLYVPYNDNCLDMAPARAAKPCPVPNKQAGLAKINMSTGEIQPFYLGPSQTNGSADSGKILWETILGGSVSVSTITYAANGKQYVAVMTGDGLLTTSLLNLTPALKPRAATTRSTCSYYPRPDSGSAGNQPLTEPRP